MAPNSNHAKNITGAVEDLLKAVTTLLDSVGSTVTSSRQVRAAAVEVKDAAKKKGKRLKTALKAYWAGMTPAQRKARIAKMHAGRRKAAKSK